MIPDSDSSNTNLLAQVLQQSVAEMYIIDSELNWIYANEAALQNLGYSLDELHRIAPAKLSARYSFEEIWRLSRPLDENPPNDAIVTFIDLHRRKNGSTYPVDKHMQKMFIDGQSYLVCTALDITEKEQTLDKLNLAIEAANLGYWESSPAENYFEASDRSLQMLGYSREELGSNLDKWMSLVNPEDLHNIHAEAKQYGRSDKSWTSEYRMKHKAGHWCWIRGATRVIARNQADDSPIRLCGTYMDVTNEKLLKSEQQKTQKLSSLGVLAGGIAHDFNNILTILFGNISLARMQQELGLPSLQELENAEQAFKRAKHLTSQLLTFAKGGDPIRQNVSISELVEEIIRFDLSGSKVKAVFTQAPDLWKADVDRGLIAQVFSNLATNANQAMPDGGHLHIIAENSLVKNNNAQGLEPGPYLKFTVQDEGKGIKDSDINQIFDPYYTTKDTGSGLGLATVYSIIKKHGGIISVNSEPQQGAKFIFYLPASKAQVFAGNSPVARSGQESRKLSILIVDDDDKLICKLAQDMLESEGHDVTFALDAKEAQRLYLTKYNAGHPFDLVIADNAMSDSAGAKALIQKLLKTDSDVYAIIMSAYTKDPAITEHSSHGFRDYLFKPFTRDSLLQVVGKL